MKKELINAQLQSKLSRDVDSKIAKRQREYYLMEQLKGIKKELGMESDGKDKLIEKFKERRESLILTDFPTAIERPSLPVTPAPIRRATFWSGEKEGEDQMPPAEGVPSQDDWVRCPRCGLLSRFSRPVVPIASSSLLQA